MTNNTTIQKLQLSECEPTSANSEGIISGFCLVNFDRVTASQSATAQVNSLTVVILRFVIKQCCVCCKWYCRKPNGPPWCCWEPKWAKWAMVSYPWFKQSTNNLSKCAIIYSENQKNSYCPYRLQHQSVVSPRTAD